MNMEIFTHGTALMTKPLSPAAQAVLDAFTERHELCGPFDDNWPELCLAAAFRAIADQIVPEDTHRCNTYTTEAIRLNRQGVRQQLLAIAAELEANR